MNVRRMLTLRIIFVCMIVGMLAPTLFAETLYVDRIGGDDISPGTKDKPLKSIDKAATMVNRSNGSGPATIKILPGTYEIDRTVVFANQRVFTEKKRLVIEAAILPDDPGWKPELMPRIFSSENLYNPEKPNRVTGTYGLRIKVSHVTIRGLKFLGSAAPNNMYAPIERIGSDLKDMLVTQCMFVGDNDSFNIYCPVIATGDKLVVDHCIFHGCHASAVFWDGLERRIYKNNAMRYCIVDGGIISGVWTCQTADDFKFHNNVVTDTEFFWMRKRIDKPIKYELRDCIVNSKNYSSYGIETGPTGLTGPEVKYDEKNIIKERHVVLVRDKKARNYMHVTPGTPGSKLGAGLFK